MFFKEIVLVEVELSSYTEKILTGGRTDRQTTQCLKGDHSQKVMQRVEVQSQQKTQRTNGPVNAHLISWPTLVKHKTYKT